MNCLVWNCQGLGRHLAIQSLSNLVQVTKPRLVFLSETKATNAYMNSIRIKLGFASGLHVERVGYGGGLSLLWSYTIDVTILSFSSGHIDAQVQDHLGLTWRFTGFYGHPRREERHHSWTLLRRLSSINNLPWLCAGDFNEIMYQWEKQGARQTPTAQMDEFKSAAEDSALKDLGCANGTFSWFGKRYSSDVRERLDRALANEEWLKLFPRNQIMMQATSKSDHLPLIISLDHAPSYACNSRVAIHRFETLWAKYEECHEVINYHWQPRTNHNPHHLMKAIDKTRIALKNWSSNKFGCLPRKISSLREQLQSLIQVPQTSSDAITKLQHELQDLESKEESYWRQRSRAEWLKFGDRNTKYFHHKANSQRRFNQITVIKDDQGAEHTSHDQIVQAFMDYFTSLFTST